MREIEFRGKRTDNNEWVFGSLISIDDGEQRIATSCLTDSDKTLPLTVCAYVVDPATVGQFTGLYAKNDKPVFDGDILQFGERRLLVWWNDEAFQWQAKTVPGYDLITLDFSSLGNNWTNIDLGNIYSEIPILGRMSTEIIGNIHDNPELIQSP